LKSLFFIESPLQLLNAYEAKNYFNIQKYDFYIRLSNEETNDSQILNLILILKIEHVKIIKINALNKGFKDYIKLIFFKFFFKFFKKKVDKIFIGNYHSGFLSLILKSFSRDKIILLDDGSKSINIQSDFTDKKNYNLFTMYDLKKFKNQIIYQNEYVTLQSRLKNLVFNQNQVLFLGLKISEINIVTEEYYLQQIKAIVKYYNKEIVYVAHRGELEIKLNKIRRIKNLKVIQLDYPIEFFGLYNNIIPAVVSSFYSTALLTMKNIYNIEADSFMFDFDKSDYKVAIQKTYDYYGKYIEVKNLND